MVERQEWQWCSRRNGIIHRIISTKARSYPQKKRPQITEDTDIPFSECPSCRGPIFHESDGKKDACYHKVKSRYKVWPSAYASGALVQCRKKGAKNWGNKSK